jgi:hypothetical protein
MNGSDLSQKLKNYIKKLLKIASGDSEPRQYTVHH